MKNERPAGQETRMGGIRNAYKVSIRKHEKMTHYFGILGVRRSYNVKGEV
jgi:hypothetical protein